MVCGLRVGWLLGLLWLFVNFVVSGYCGLLGVLLFCGL